MRVQIGTTPIYRRNNSKQVYLKTLGQPLFVSLEAVQNVQTGHDFFLGIQTDNPSISNKTLINIAARYRRFHGGNSVEPHFVSALIESGDICKDFFDWKQFVFEEKVDEETVKVNKPVVFCNDVASFVDFVKHDGVDSDDNINLVGSKLIATWSQSITCPGLTIFENEATENITPYFL